MSEPQPTSNAGRDPNGFAEILRAAMDRKGWSQAETAREINRRLPPGRRFSPVNLNHYLKGRSLPRGRYREALMAVLAIEDESAFGDKNAPAAPRRRNSETAEPVAHNGGVTLVDQGSEVLLKIDQRVTWPVALAILNALKRPT